MVCMKSRIGRTTAKADLLLAHQIPIGMPMAMQMKAAAPSSATVAMDFSQKPRKAR